MLRLKLKKRRFKMKKRDIKAGKLTIEPNYKKFGGNNTICISVDGVTTISDKFYD